MQSPWEVFLSTLATRAYATGLMLHGEVNLELEAYTSHLIHVVKKCSGEDPTRARVLAVFSQLHTNDLYLSVACAEGSEPAWNRFWAIHRKHVFSVAKSVCRSRGDASDLADGILSHLYMRDGSGRSRIGSYEGLSSLDTWLDPIIQHQAAKERERKSSHFERLDDLPDIADYTALDRVESKLRASTYESLAKDSLLEASKSIGERERLMLGLRYQRGLRRTEIAQIAGMHPRTVTRHLQQTRQTLRERITTTLSSKHGLSSVAIEECVADILNNPAYSLLS